MNAQIRKRFKAGSNNDTNPDQNICTLAVARWAGVQNNVRYLHTYDDLKRALRSRFSVRSVKSALGKAKTVGAARKEIANLFSERDDLVGVYISVPGHAMLIGPDGKTIIDTAPRTRDRRRILHATGIYWK